MFFIIKNQRNKIQFWFKFVLVDFKSISNTISAENKKRETYGKLDENLNLCIFSVTFQINLLHSVI